MQSNQIRVRWAGIWFFKKPMHYDWSGGSWNYKKMETEKQRSDAKSLSKSSCVCTRNDPHSRRAVATGCVNEGLSCSNCGIRYPRNYTHSTHLHWRPLLESLRGTPLQRDPLLVRGTPCSEVLVASRGASRPAGAGTPDGQACLYLPSCTILDYDMP